MKRYRVNHITLNPHALTLPRFREGWLQIDPTMISHYRIGLSVLNATTVHRRGRAFIFGLITTTGRRFTISGTRKPVLKSHITTVPSGGCSAIGIITQPIYSHSPSIAPCWNQKGDIIRSLYQSSKHDKYVFDHREADHWQQKIVSFRSTPFFQTKLSGLARTMPPHTSAESRSAVSGKRFRLALMRSRQRDPRESASS